MLRRLSYMLGVVATLAFAMSTVSAPKAFAHVSGDKLDFNGWVWSMFRMDMTSHNSKGNRTGIDNDEVELDITYKFDDTWSADIGFYMGRWTGAAVTGPGFFIIKNGFVEGKGLWGEGSHLTIGMEDSPWFHFVEIPWGFNWLDGYTVGLQSGFQGRHVTGIRADGGMNMLTYSFFLGSGENFDANGILSNNAMNASLLLQLKPMDELAITAIGTYWGGSGQAGSNHTATTVGGSVVYKTSMYGLMGEVHDGMTDHCGQSSWFVCSGSAATDHKISSMGYGIHGFFNFNEHVGLYARYTGGNADYSNNNAGAVTQWFYYAPDGTTVEKAYKSRITVGPTFHIIKDKLMAAALYETMSLGNTAKAATGLSSMSQFRINLAAFF